MSGAFEFYRDEHGNPRWHGGEGMELAGVFLETDLQEDDALGAEILKDLKSIRDGSVDKGVFVGNAHVLQITGDWVSIESQYDDNAHSLDVPIGEFIDLVAAWLAFTSAGFAGGRRSSYGEEE